MKLSVLYMCMKKRRRMNTYLSTLSIIIVIRTETNISAITTRPPVRNHMIVMLFEPTIRFILLDACEYEY